MADPYTKGEESITQAEHISLSKTGDNIEAKRVANYSWDGTNWQRQSTSSGRLVSQDFDYVSVDYPDATTEVYSYKAGGSTGTLVAIVTVIYTDGTKATISSVART